MPHVVQADLKAAQTALGAGDFVAALKEVQPVWQTHPGCGLDHSTLYP